MSKRIKLRRSQNHNTWGKLLQSYSKRTDPEAKKFFAALVSEILQKPFSVNHIRWTGDCDWCAARLPAILTLNKLPPAIFETEHWEQDFGLLTMLVDGTMIVPRETELIIPKTLALTAKVKAVLKKKSSFPRAKNV